MEYIKKHWNGKHSLALSFWVNVFLLNIVIRLLLMWFEQTSPIDNPVSAAQAYIIFSFLTIVIIYPWQVIGLWASACRYTEEEKKRFWGGAVKVFVVLGVLGTFGNLSKALPDYKNIYQLGFGKDAFDNYQVKLIKNDTLIHLKGGLGFGVSKKVNYLIKNNTNVKGIILDSQGGRIYEGRELSKIILLNDLDTYSLTGCYSACGTAFISGSKRYLAKGANLAFHQYRTDFKSLNTKESLSLEQKKDLEIYKRKEISQGFMNKIFNAEKDDLWYPTIEEMLSAGVIHALVNPSDLKQLKHDSIAKNDLEKMLLKYAAYKSIKKYEPKVYKQILTELKALYKRDASRVEIQEKIGKYIALLAAKSLPKTSSKALLTFSRATTDILTLLEKKDPILCLKNLYPDKYGALDMAKYLSKKEMQPMLEALNIVIKDSYEKKYGPVDEKEAIKLMVKVMSQLEGDSRYLDAVNLNNKNEYSKGCKAVVKFYELISSGNNELASNGLRYVFSQ